MNQFIKNAIILTVITLSAGVLLGFVYELTKGPIAASKEKARQKAYQQIFPDANEFEDSTILDEKEADKLLGDAGLSHCHIDQVVNAKKNQEHIGYIITVTNSQGYGGDIQLSLGVYQDGRTGGISIQSIHETAGLGMKAKEPEFYGQFADKNTQAFQVVKGGTPQGNTDATSGATSESVAAETENIDAISGATITSNAVTEAVNAGLLYYQYMTTGGRVK